MGLQQRYFKEKAEQDEKIKGLDKQVLMILGLANEVKELKDARLRQIELNREIIDAVIYEVDCFRNQSWWRRLLNLNPPHWIDDRLDKEPIQYFQKIIWNDLRKALHYK